MNPPQSPFKNGEGNQIKKGVGKMIRKKGS